LTEVTLRLRPWLVLVFVGLVVPVFGLVLVFNDFTAERVAREAANGLVERVRQEDAPDQARARYGEVLRFEPDDRLASRMPQLLA
jgi:hypothetical protein